MKSDFDVVTEFAQQALALTPVIILGSGASAAHGLPGMWPLAGHLRGLTVPIDWNSDEKSEWQRFIDILGGDADLETALQAIRPTDRQTAYIAEATRTFLLPGDEAVFLHVLADRRALPLTRLFRHLFSSVHTSIDVVTPNYDRIAEYAADAGEYAHHTGFSSGYLQSRPKTSWRGAAVTDASRVVRVWKVHGSLDWFQSSAGQVVGVRVGRETPPGFSPLMITPGIDKYRLARTEPFITIFSCADAALETARSYLCVGYGFNDPHVQAKLVERCDSDSVPIVVITKALSETAKAFLGGGRCRRYVAIEDDNAGGARAFTHEHPGGIPLPMSPVWTLPGFLDLTLGADV